MSLTLRLTADLTLALAARALPNRNDFSPILKFSAGAQSNATPDSLPESDGGGANDFLQSLSSIPRYRSPIVWIDGPAPLDDSGIARLANSLVASGRHVFLETSGASLKTRLHELRPSSRLYLAIRLNTRRLAADPLSDHHAALRVGLEAIRMSRLAGFYTCARLIVARETHGSELEALHAEIRKLDVDGVLITPAGAEMTPEFEMQFRQWRSASSAAAARCSLPCSAPTVCPPLPRAL